ncbi:RsmB/NOP family class I SAM-dependent RNA methyltransferase [Paracoccus sp. CPCC 101403]|uniref:RsmB/NOP family class I SAM-dependent RNA methyltransferase n=1 Tax=Paracoccus broussonetiae TaxID=3075834 RepID=A0ABU3EGZ6_9RHOB|nr:RsmB/NOP family class I SAM-dependent RNA methyltransferase [Paracoccus sp. CPCC 101403]MDT1063464.1 RsmB/NOP family class I SAM-dependent RNA methyltransferase [Paracoccus sp. CPCC 101403]
MTPAARAQAAITVLDQVLSGEAAEAALIRWARNSRFAGSGDRAAVRDIVFDALRRMRSRAALGGALSGRGLILGMCRDEGTDPAQVFTGAPYAPAMLEPAEVQSQRASSPAEAMDLPDWMQPLWRDALGETAADVAAAMRVRAPVWLRANTLRASPDEALAALERDGIVARPSAKLASALEVIEGARRVSASGAYADGLVELQDLSPQLACAALPRVGSALDYCAGGGGKALALAAAGVTRIVAHDVEASRMADLPGRAKRAGARLRIAAPGRVEGKFDLVLTDVPCSGSGTWRRTPDAKWRLDRAGLDRLVALQARIMDEAAAFVAPGGHLAYMTCSVFEQENAEQVATFRERSDFEPVSELRLTPLNASDGFYLALMRRR